MTKKLKFLLSAVTLCLTAIDAFAQDNGAAGITDATSMVTSYFDPATKLIYAIGAVVGLIGGVGGVINYQDELFPYVPVL
jgi:hypothetical protein